MRHANVSNKSYNEAKDWRYMRTVVMSGEVY